MCRRATIRWVAAAGVMGLWAWSACAQTPSLDWRHIGNSAVELALPSLATGPVNRVWYSDDGFVLYARTASGKTFETKDFEQWRRVTDSKIAPPAETNPATENIPESGFRIGTQASTTGRLYGVGRNAYRSDDGGRSWSNLTAFRGRSILGDGLTDTAASPRDPEEVVVAAQTGLWRSVDGGLSWTGLNDFLPNLPGGRLTAVPSGARGVRLALANGPEIEWAPGEKAAWRPVGNAEADAKLKAALSQTLKHNITAIATAKAYIYAGDSEGRLQVSPDAGASWPGQFKLADLGPVQAIWVDNDNPWLAVAVLGARATPADEGAKPTYVLRTMNGGAFWDDITSNLPASAVAHGVAADRATGAIYIATDLGVFFTMTDLGIASVGRPTPWTSLGENLPATAATDVKLDAGANQLYAVLDGYGVYATIAPHRFRDVRLVSAADYSTRAAAPGALLSVLGARVESARSANTVVPVLAASDSASQIQVPFDAKGNTVSLALEAAAGRLLLGLPLQNVSPAIFVDPEGTPLIMDADTGVLLDASKPAHANSRIQILATGFGRVKPDWPTGLAAPVGSDPPRVVAQVHAYLDQQPVEVSQAVLAGGYVGFYLIEVQLPRIVNAGPAELYVEAEGQQSNRVRLYLEP